jgi:putative nucleotidyltransferase with HDIG domain
VEREEALRLVREKVAEANLVKHMLAAEAVMRGLARRLEQDEGSWALAGLIHDLDYGETAKDPARHGRVTVSMLEGKDVPAPVLDAILSHAGHRERASLMDKALWAADPVTGLVTAAALVRPDKKLEPVQVENLSRRFREKGFARGADRGQIASCAEMGIPLEEFLGIALAAMKGIAADLGL